MLVSPKTYSLTKIRATSASGSRATNSDTSVDGLKALAATDVIIKAIIDPTPAPRTMVSVAGPATLNPNPPPPEVGVYGKDGASFVLIQAQAVSQSKVGGKTANVFT